MRRRDFLKAGLIMAAIPVGGKMMWDSTSIGREMEIRKRMKEGLISRVQMWPQIKEAIPHVDDVLDVVFSSDERLSLDDLDGDQYFFDLLSSVNLFLLSHQNPVLELLEVNRLAYVYSLIGIKYEDVLSHKARNVLRGTVAVVAKVYQLRPNLEFLG